MCININLCCKPHVIPSEVGDPQQHVAPFKAVKVKLLRVDLLHHLKHKDSRGETKIAVCPSGPSIDGRARLDVRLWKIARLKHVFL